MSSLSVPFLVTLFAAFLPGAMTGFAADTRQVDDEFRQALLRLAQAGQLPAQGQPMLIERPAERVANFGLLLDRDDSQGLRVLGTLPGASAERIGLRAGDRLLAANGTDLTGVGGSERMRALLDSLPPSQPLSLRVHRDGSDEQLSGTVDAFDLPAVRIELLADAGTSGATSGSTPVAADGDSTCGRISVFEGAPRSQHLFAALLIQVDGNLPGPSSQETFRATPGKHTLTVAEAIDPKYFSDVANRLRGTGRDNRKTLEITVEPGVTYYLAARLHPDRASSIADGSYWEPVIWKESAERCR